MKREIKFRAWDKGNEYDDEEDRKPRMVYGVEKLYDGSITELGGHGSFGQLLDEERFVVMQFTGLTASDGVTEVYEHDIISGDGLVVGNLYESPQILKEGNHQTIALMGTDAWRVSESVAMGRGCKYAQH